MAQKERVPMKNLTVRLSEDEIQWLKTEAAKEMRPVALYIRWIIAEHRKTKRVQNPQTH